MNRWSGMMRLWTTLGTNARHHSRANGTRGDTATETWGARRQHTLLRALAMLVLPLAALAFTFAAAPVAHADPIAINGACGAASSTTTGLSFNGDPNASYNDQPTAFWDDGSFSSGWLGYDSNPGCVLTDDGYGEANSIFTNSTLTLGNFSSTFDFRTDAGLQMSNGGNPADGFAFVLQQQGSGVYGVAGSGLGFAGLAGYGAIFRTYDQTECGDGVGRFYVGAALGSDCGTNSDAVTVLKQADASDALNDQTANWGNSYSSTDPVIPWHHAQVTVVNGAMSVTIDGTPRISNIPLPGYAPTQGYYFGFTGGTGGLTEFAEVRNWTLTGLYQPAGTTCVGAAGHAILQPINADGTSVFKLGSTVPAKFRVCDIVGNSVGTPGVVTSFKLVKTSAGGGTTVNEDVTSTTPDTAFRWDATNQQWIFNIGTKGLSAGTTYSYEITLNDGTTIDFSFSLK